MSDKDRLDELLEEEKRLKREISNLEVEKEKLEEEVRFMNEVLLWMRLSEKTEELLEGVEVEYYGYTN